MSVIFCGVLNELLVKIRLWNVVTLSRELSKECDDYDISDEENKAGAVHEE